MPETPNEDNGTAIADPLMPEAFYQTWFAPVYAYFARRTPDAASAEDLTADAFERMLAALPDLRSEGAAVASVRAWVYRVAANVYKNALRGTSRRVARDARWIEGWRPNGGHPAETEQGIVLGLAVAQLPPDDQDLLGLRYWDGLTAAEIAAVRGCEVRAVYTAIERALRTLRRTLASDGVLVGGAAPNRVDTSKEVRRAHV